MANICPNCKSGDTQVGIDNTGCLNCGTQFNTQGEAVAAGPGATTRAVLEQRLAPRSTTLVGNLADLQRAGAEVAVNGGSFEDGVAPPPGVDTDSDAVLTPSQHDASRGEITRETVRTGDADALIEAGVVAAYPPEETGPKVVDPGNQRPQVVDAGDPALESGGERHPSDAGPNPYNNDEE
jgi:hypothetical protein